MKKRIFVCVLLIACMLMTFGCGSGNEIASGGVYMLLYFGIMAAGFILMMIADREIYRTNDLNPVARLGTVPRWIAYWFMGLSVCWFYIIAATGAAGSASFIYFGF